MKKIIKTNMAPEAIGPYSQAVEVNGILFVSGQIPLDNKGNLVGDDILDQTQQVLENLESVLLAAGYEMTDVVKTTCYLSDMSMFADFNDVYARHFKDAKPARATVEVSRLPKDVLVEVDAVVAK